jgi:hypothetical protein
VTRRSWCLALAVFLAACDDSPVAPTDATTTTTTTTTTASVELFSGTLDPGGSAFFSFHARGGQVKAQLSSLTLIGSREASTAAVRVGVGVPRGLGCEVSSSLQLSPGLVSQAVMEIPAGIHCISVEDSGGLSSRAQFLLKFEYI